MKEEDQDYCISRAFYTEKNWFPSQRRRSTIDIAFVLQHRHTILSDSTSTG
jgi:hypothetical protein